MQPIKIYTIGKIKNKSLITEIDDLKKRVTRLEIIELKEIKDKNSEIVKKKEFELIKDYVLSSNFNFLLWEFGTQFNTKEFYDKLSKIDRNICFFITGAFGPNDDLKKLITNHISLSKMTFTHEQALYMLVEQVYRCECYEKGINYTK